VWLRPQDAFIGRGGVAASGALASRLGLSGVPVAAETIALHTIFELMRVTGARVHLCRLSSAAGLALVREAKAEGLPVTCDVGVNHLHLIDVDIGYFDSQFRLDPPLRSERDREAIRAALADGTIDAICSDHTPVDDDEKLLPFAEATPGATGLELLLSLTVKWADETGTPLAQALRRITAAPADVLQLPAGRPPKAAPPTCACSIRVRTGGRAACAEEPGPQLAVPRLRIAARVRATLVGGHVAFERH
jgi:dihydroorotase